MLLNRTRIIWVNNALLLVALIILVYFLSQNIKKISLNEISFCSFHLILSFLLIILAQYFQAYLWHRITIENGCQIRYNNAIYFRLKNEIFKYIPGKVAQVGSILVDYDAFSVPKIKVAYSIFLENIYSMLASILASVFLLSFYVSNIFLIILIFIILFIVILFLYKKALSVLLKIYSKIKSVTLLELNTQQMSIYFLLLYTATWFVYGFGFFFLIKSFFSNINGSIIVIISSFSASSLIGFWAFFTPAGLGFREGSLILILKTIIPSSVLLISILLSRVQIIVCDLVIFLVSFIIFRRRNAF